MTSAYISMQTRAKFGKCREEMSELKTHICGKFPSFLCGEVFLCVYSLSGDTTQKHTDIRENSTCETCNQVYDRLIKR